MIDIQNCRVNGIKRSGPEDIMFIVAQLSRQKSEIFIMN